MWRRIFAFLVGALALAIPSAAQELDATIKLGDQFDGKILFGADVDAIRFDSVAGAQVTFTISGKGKLEPFAVLLDADTGQVVPTSGFESGLGGSKFKIKKAPIPSTGTYELRIGSFNGKKGNYTVKTKVKYPDAISELTGTFGVSAGQTTPLTFEAQPGTKVSGKIKFASGLDVELDTLVTPDTTLDISSFITPKSNKLKVASIKLASLGQHVLLIEGGLAAGSVDVKLDVIHPKSKKKKFVEPKEDKDPGSISGDLLIADVPVAPRSGAERHPEHRRLPRPRVPRQHPACRRRDVGQRVPRRPVRRSAAERRPRRLAHAVRRVAETSSSRSSTTSAMTSTSACSTRSAERRSASWSRPTSRSRGSSMSMSCPGSRC